MVGWIGGEVGTESSKNTCHPNDKAMYGGLDIEDAHEPQVVLKDVVSVGVGVVVCVERSVSDIDVRGIDGLVDVGWDVFEGDSGHIPLAYG